MQNLLVTRASDCMIFGREMRACRSSKLQKRNEHVLSGCEICTYRATKYKMIDFQHMNLHVVQAAEST